MSISERVVVVTGGSRGLGLCLVKDLLQRGYRVATCSRNKGEGLEAIEKEIGDPSRFFWEPCSVGVEEDEDRYFGKVLAWCGPRAFYGLVNNAGIAGEGILATYPNVDSERILQVNLVGALRMARLALRSMLGRPGAGRLINISSIVGLRGYTGLAAYSASKAGMDAMVRALAREVGRRQITVNSVAPGYLLTDLSASLGEHQRQQIIRRTPLGRLGNVEDVSPVVNFLLSDEAAFITGQTLVVDGGISS